MGKPARSSWYLVPAALALAASLACGGGGGGGGGSGAGWTVLVYVVADNNLEPYALYNLEQMAGVGSSAGLNIVAEVDRAPSGQYTPAGTGVLNLSAWTGARRIVARAGSLEQVADLGEVDSADPDRLASFVEWGVKTYPADHYMLVLWDHGGGWQGFAVDETVPGAPSDQTTMQIPAIRSGVAAGLSAAGISRLDVLAFDACMMASVEVAQAMAPYARYLLASEEVVPGHGLDYGALAGASSLSPLALARQVTDGYQALANSPQWNDGAGITMSVVDLDKLGPVQAALASLAAGYGTSPAVAPHAAAIAQGRAEAVGFGPSPTPGTRSDLVDLGDLFGRISSLGSTASTLRTAVQGAVVYKIAGSAFTDATGLSAYFPVTPGGYSSVVYEPLPGMDDWRQFILAYYDAAGGSADPEFASASYAAEATEVTLDGILTPGTLALLGSASLAYGLPGASGDAWLFGDLPAWTETDGGGDHVIGSWDYSFLRLSQSSPAAHEEYGYSSISSLDPETVALTIPMSYDPGDGSGAQQVARIVTVDLGTAAVRSDVTYAYSGDLVGELVPAAGSTMHGLVLHLPVAGSWSWTMVEYTDVGAFDATEPIDLDFSTTLSSGDPFFAGLLITNAAGSPGWIATSVAPAPVVP